MSTSNPAHEKRNRRNTHKQTTKSQKQTGHRHTNTESSSHFSSSSHIKIWLTIAIKLLVSKPGVMVWCISAVLGLLFSLGKWQIQSTATCWYGGLFLWKLAIGCGLCYFWRQTTWGNTVFFIAATPCWLSVSVPISFFWLYLCVSLSKQSFMYWSSDGVNTSALCDDADLTLRKTLFV